MKTTLKNSCSYSFKDLFKASNFTEKVDLQKMEQTNINTLVKSRCKKAGWYWYRIYYFFIIN